MEESGKTELRNNKFTEVRTFPVLFALTEINIPTYPATPDRKAPIKYPIPTR